MNMGIVIVDFNKIFSALLHPNAPVQSLLQSESIRFFAPNYLINELFRHKERVLSFSKLSPLELDEILEKCLENLRFYPLAEIKEENRQLAYELTHDVDLKDLPYVALTLELDGLLWTGDKKLKTALLAKGFDHFFEFPLAT
ncbi:MAG: PIN domain-containing protein [Saprospiraceae bacterium]